VEFKEQNRALDSWRAGEGRTKVEIMIDTMIDIMIDTMIEGAAYLPGSCNDLSN
jgi:hypothetical protein